MWIIFENMNEFFKKMEIIMDFWNYYNDVVTSIKLTCGLMKYDIVMSKNK